MLSGAGLHFPLLCPLDEGEERCFEESLPFNGPDFPLLAGKDNIVDTLAAGAGPGEIIGFVSLIHQPLPERGRVLRHRGIAPGISIEGNEHTGGADAVLLQLLQGGENGAPVANAPKIEGQLALAGQVYRL